MINLLGFLRSRTQSRRLSLAQAESKLGEYGIKLDELDIPLSYDADPNHLHQYFEGIDVKTNFLTGSAKLVGRFYRQPVEMTSQDGTIVPRPGSLARYNFSYSLG